MTSSSGSHRLSRVCFVIAFGLNCWIWMQFVHESGHAAAAIITGGQLRGIVWHVSTISRTDVFPNPHPVVVCWAGPLIGCITPLLALYVAGQNRRSARLRFFAGFCLIANGAYLAFGSIDRIGDAGQLIRLGNSVVTLWGIGIVLMLAGLWTWHTIGRLIDIRALSVSAKDCAVQICLLATTLAIQHTFFRHS